MKAEIRTFVIDTCCWVVTISIIFFFFTLWLFSYNNIEAPLKESWSLTVGIISALATLGAAIIASRLFQNWKNQHSFTEQVKVLTQLLVRIDEIQDLFWEARINETLMKIILNQPYKSNLTIDFNNQKEKFVSLSQKISSLYKLEKQLYLLNNSKNKQTIFKKNENNNLMPISELLDFIYKAQMSLVMLEIFLSEKRKELIGNNNDLNEPNIEGLETILSSKSVDFSSEYFIEHLMNLLVRGEIYLGLAYPACPDVQTNLASTKINNQINILIEQIMSYRDKLEALD